MRIVIDLQGTKVTSNKSGLTRHTIEFTKACIRNRGHHEILLVLSNLFPDAIESIRTEFDELIPPENIHVWNTRYQTNSYANNKISNNAELIRESFLKTLNPDIVHICNLFATDYINSINKYITNIKTSVTLHDLIPHINRKTYFKNKKTESWYNSKLEDLQRANLILSISESARLEGIDFGLAPKKIKNISSGASDFFQKLTIDDKTKQYFLDKYGLSKPFIMYVGTTEVRKNFKRFISAYARLSSEIKNNHQLLLIIKLNIKNKIKYKILMLKEKLNSLGIVMINSISDDDLRLFYNLCKLFVFPSYHEGFGLPVIEAMKCGTPVICSNVTSLPEIVENTKAMFDPYSIESIRNIMTEVLTNENFRQKLILNSKEQAKKFSWDLTSQRAIKAFENLYEEKNKI